MRALTDGLLIQRYLFQLTGQTLVDGVVDEDAMRTDPIEIVAHLDCIRSAHLDIDADSSEHALTDGMVILRYFFGLRGDVLMYAAVAPACSRCIADDIEQYIAGGLAP